MCGVSEEYRELYSELTEYERYGIQMSMEGEPASPMQIVTAHMVKEDSVYMRDYVTDDDGHLCELCFHNIKKVV